MARVFNCSAGPATLPFEVLEEAGRELTDYHGLGMSIAEMSHRGKAYSAVHDEAIANLRELLDIPEEYAVLFLQGGATAQFAMVPMNLLRPGATADYTHTGAWAKKAIQEARVVGDVHIAADTSQTRPCCMPDPATLAVTPNAAYLHITTNETIEGSQWKRFPVGTVPLVADMSSDFLSRPFDVRDFGLIYAGAQKNLSVAGVTLVIIRRDLAERAPSTVPSIFRYRTHIEDNSMHNTPPCFAIYLTCLVTRWVKKVGRETLYRQNREKAARLYAAIDAGDFYRGTADPAHRSDMNVTFRLPSEELETRFVKEAEKHGISGLKGHRSVGGIRASIYNAFPVEGVDALVACMREFERVNG